MSENIQYSIALGALLHDIGKFFQRADKKDESLSANTKKLESVICQSRGRYYSHRHVLWTRQFFDDFYQSLPIPVDTALTESNVDTCANLACRHHNPETELQHIVQQADCLSAGMDRTKSRDMEDEIKSFRYKKIRLHSIFEDIDLGHNSKKQNNYRYELKPLQPSKSCIFPTHREHLTPPEGDELVDVYRKLWNNFIEEFDKLPAQNLDIYFANLLGILEKYLWCIPSSTIDYPDISLYDHSKTTAAIAVCLYEYHRQTDTLDTGAIKNRYAKKFILVGGDLSGIQKYIFNLRHANIKKVSKILRARSFYLTELSVVSSHLLLHELNLPLCCNIMDSGGRFILLTPNTERTRTILKKTYQQMSRWCKDEFAGELLLNLTWDISLSGSDFSQKDSRFRDKMDELNDAIEMKKEKKLYETGRSGEEWDYREFRLDRDYPLYKNGVCECCGKFPLEARTSSGEGEIMKLCSQCATQSEVGKWLIHNNLYGYSRNEAQSTRSIPYFGKRYFVNFLRSEDEVSDRFYLIEKSCNSGGIVSSYKTRMVANYIPLFGDSRDADQQYTFYTEELQKEDDLSEVITGLPKTFDYIAKSGISKNENKLRGKPMLGILKADVDRLGYIFSIGMGERMSISRYSTLSRMIDTFFSAYLNNLLESNNEYRDTYTVYSGGDDLFLVGEWKAIISLAKTIYDDFKEYGGMNPDIHLSAGIANVMSRFPVHRAATLAELFLDESKKERDRLTIFNTTIDWKRYDDLMEFAAQLDAFLNDKDSKVTPGFVYRLLHYHALAQEYLEKNNIEGMMYLSRMNYDIGRNIIERNKDGTITSGERELEELIKLQDIEFMKDAKIPIFWIIWKNRTERRV
jgi:CRISPR-associated protein Csm1